MTGFENVLLIKEHSLSATLYYHPPEQQNYEFWNVDRTLLMAISTHFIIKKHEDEMYEENFVIGRLSSFIIAQIFNKTSYNVTGSDQLLGFSKSVHSIYSKLLDIHNLLGKQKMKSLYDALNESIGDDYSKQRQNRAYLLALHKSGDLSRVYMTMSIRRLSPNKIEHRHIQQSVRAIVEPMLAPVWGYNVDTIPERISMLMHNTSLRFMQKLHPEVSQLEINPLHSMYMILYKEGLVPFPVKEETAYYGILISGTKFVDLRESDFTRRVTRGRVIGTCINCTEVAKFRCEKCSIPLVCTENVCMSLAKTHTCE